MYEMHHYIDVDRVVDADTEEEALFKTEGALTAGEGYDNSCWWDSGPSVERVDDQDQ
jgi:hypothetical protein